MTLELINVDCMEIMPKYPDKHFDLAIVDPPYGIGNFVQTTGNVRGKAVIWNDKTLHDDFFKVLKKISKNQIIWGANYYNCFDKKGGAIIWIKNQPMPNFSKAEIASCTMHKKVEIYEQTWTNFVNTKTTCHPCEKPVALYKWLLNNYAKPGQRILDTHGGSGSIAIACHYFGCDLVWIEKDKEYFEAAKARIEKETRQLDLGV